MRLHVHAKWLLGSALSLQLSAAAIAATPLVPSGWAEIGDSGRGARTFAIPQWRRTLAHRAYERAPAKPSRTPLPYKDGETITYKRRANSWIAVSGYRGGEIFYRKGNLASGGTRWHMVEFKYPREAKGQMDAAVAAVSHGMGAYGGDCR